ncbi:carbohydrate sulfotransferase 11-like [Penaeus japonicus]|uniref:carbohydrate sulfotransferase 11-like n=1 Tax=Penaeus japonicus TaxID=27405 RepID=UPI001C710C4E|nr:carbohydrate sulfotransferase 11-like [Penaeus japonicus]
MALQTSRRNVFLFFLAFTTVLIFTTHQGLFNMIQGTQYVLPKSRSRKVLQDLMQLKAKERKNVNLNKTSNQKGVRSSTPVLRVSYGAALRNISYSSYSPEDAAILKSRVDVMSQRAKVVSQVCQAKKSLNLKPGKISVVWDTKHNPGIVWCPVYKVASTTWMRNFLRLAHFNEDNPKIPKNIPKEKQDKRRFSVRFGATHNRVFELYPGPEDPVERDRVMQESVRVIIVRHPFARLLSAYRDKMIKKNPIPVRFKFKELQRYIVSKYRDNNSSDTSSFPSFAEFVQYVIDSTKEYETPKEWTDNVKCWLPYWVHCSVCSTDYNIIMKLETMKDDERFLITLSRLEELKDIASWVHLKGSSSADLAKEYYKDVTRRQMEKLYQRYRPDFDLFQYDIDDFLAIAKDSNGTLATATNGDR